MPRKFSSILRSANDDKLVRLVSNTVLKEPIDFPDSPDAMSAEQVLLVSENTHGIVANGGMRYLLEHDFGDSAASWGLLISAFNALGATQCATSMTEALALFAKSHQPGSNLNPLETYLASPIADRDRIDIKFWEGANELVARQATFIREHADVFATYF